MSAGDLVVVLLDGEPLRVPRRVDSHWAFRGVLGLRRDESARLAGQPGLVHARRGYEFSRGERFETVTEDDLLGDGGRPWEGDSDGWKGGGACPTA